MELEELLNDAVVNSNHRGHVGLSQIGHSCSRYLQFTHYWAFDVKYSERIKRLFNVGNMMEEVITKDLGKHGLNVDSEQLEITGFSGHFLGHIDGKIGDRLVEFKTHNDKSFKDLMKKKVKMSKPVHYSQMQSYMGYLELKESLYVAYNKNDSAYYFENVNFNEEHFNGLKEKEKTVILSEELLPRTGNNSSAWFECKWCDARDVCFNKKEPSKNCRTCNHVDVLADGEWECSIKNLELTESMQRDGCGKYESAIIFKELQ